MISIASRLLLISFTPGAGDHQAGYNAIFKLLEIGVVTAEDFNVSSRFRFIPFQISIMI